MTAPADTGALLSTLAGAGATLVAIVGGLLVSRYVSLDSELAGARRRLHEIDTRLVDARAALAQAELLGEMDDVEHAFYDFDVWDKVITWVEQSPPESTAVDADDLVNEIGYVVDLTKLRDDLVRQHLNTLIASVRAAAKALSGAAESIAPGVHRRRDIEQWEDLSRTLGIHSDMPQLWEYYYETRTVPKIVQNAQEKLDKWNLQFFEPITGPGRPSMRAALRPGSLAIPQRLQRRLDDSRDTLQALEAEQGLARLAADAIGRPAGLVLGLSILGVLTLLQIVPPVLFLAFGPDELSTRATWLVVSLFFLGMAALLAYLVSYARRLGLLQRG